MAYTSITNTCNIIIVELAGVGIYMFTVQLAWSLAQSYVISYRRNVIVTRGMLCFSCMNEQLKSMEMLSCTHCIAIYGDALLYTLYTLYSYLPRSSISWSYHLIVTNSQYSIFVSNIQLKLVTTLLWYYECAHEVDQSS